MTASAGVFGTLDAMNATRTVAFMEAQFLRLEEAAARLGRSISTVRRLVRAGDLTTSVILGRVVILRAEVDGLRDRRGAR